MTSSRQHPGSAAKIVLRATEKGGVDPQLFAAVVDSAPDGIVLVDEGGRIVFANRMVEALLGYAPEELVGQPVELIVPERARDQHVGHRAAYHAFPASRPMGSGLNLAARRRDGSELPVEISLSPIRTEDGLYVTAIIRDISLRAQLEQDRLHRRAEAELQLDRERIARDLHDGVMQSLYGVGLALLGTRNRSGELSAAVADELDAAVAALNGVIGDIRHFVLNLPLERTSGAIGGLLQALVDEASDQASLDATIEVAPDLPLLTDQQKVVAYSIVREALTNVLRHAGAHSVVVRAQHDPHGITFEVRDDGAGFAVDDARSLEHMGLRNMRTRAEQVGGAFEVQSAPGAGTLVRLRLPLAQIA